MICIVSVSIFLNKFSDLLIGKSFKVSGNAYVSVASVKSYRFPAYGRIAVQKDEKRYAYETCCDDHQKEQTY